MALLAGVGMFVEVLTWIGARGWFVANALSLPSILQYVAIAVTLPVFGGISAFGSASILGGPFVMAFLALDNIIVASALSLLAALGEFLPPTAMSATLVAEETAKVFLKSYCLFFRLRLRFRLQLDDIPAVLARRFLLDYQLIILLFTFRI